MSEDSIAYTVQGVGITAKQRDAGLAAMTGDFSKNDVAGAMIRSGVPSRDWVGDRAADRLLQSERKAHRIYAISNRAWRKY